VIDDVPVGLLVDHLHPGALLATKGGRLAGRGHVLPGGTTVDLRSLHGHRNRSLLHANVPPVMSSKENKPERGVNRIGLEWIRAVWLTQISGSSSAKVKLTFPDDFAQLQS